ncbi:MULTISPECIES: dihydrofolate reductase family protein [unclassified Rhizobium]|uniref:RibD family protein n=1 Tax=unclassified Rhizobium TaxID=2613769 RepID=UPI0016113DB7|nr:MULTISPECIES: dihydrofolate reductase family protein [unclassified Rhizobium]MBB3319307.1 riboflavin biosynthesis pyrimidine reductase [Rhizobium sp. BK181]MCS4094977.1 riboflavin biosynthesis pyrimidine reductase [Rhizobium sp. BK176]
MLTSPDGSLHPSRWTKSPDGSKADWSSLYEKVQKELGGNAWMVGRVTMAEISKATAHPPAVPASARRPTHFARPDAESFAIALDPSGKLHFAAGELYGDHVVVLLGSDVSDSHLAELAAYGVSYVVSDGPDIDVGEMLDVLGEELGVDRIVLEGGARINGSLMTSGLVDELSLIVAPALESRRGSDRVIEFGEEGLAGKVELSLIECTPLGNGALHLRYAVLKQSGAT